ANPLVVRVFDNSNNPVDSTSITFSIESVPVGATGYSLNPPSVLTDQNGFAQTLLTVGNKAGTYVVKPYNDGLKNSGQIAFDSLYAIADTASKIIVYSGDSQTDIVRQILPLPIRVKVTDQNDNPIENASVNWQATSTGLVDTSSSATDAQGIASTNWTLRTIAGPDTLIATVAGVGGDTIYATAIHDIADSIAVYEGDSTTTIAGSGRLIKAIVYDLYNNIVENTTVNFLPASRVSSQTDLSNENGIAQTIYTTPSALDSSFARAYISGLTDTAVYKIYTVRYIANSLQPKVASTDTTLDFFVSFSNPGVDTVYLNQGTDTTSFSFTDGIRTTSANLDSSMILLPQTDTTTLKFGNAIIDGNFTSGNYTPEINFIGTSGGIDISGTLNTNPGELSIEPLDILSINIVGTTVITRGDTLQNVEMRIRNNSPYIIENITDSLTFSQAGIEMIRFPANLDTIAANSNVVTFGFQVRIPAGATQEIVTIDGYISGNLRTNGNLIYDDNARTTDSFEIVSAANVSFVSFTPDTVSSGQDVQYRVTVNNSGSANVLLDGSLTTWQFGSQKISLGNDQAITDTANSTLIFPLTTLTLDTGSYTGTLILVGTENGGAFTDTIYTNEIVDSLLVVQSTATLSLQAITLSDTVVSQGESGQTLQITVQNDSDATAQISSVNIFNDSLYTLTANQTLPMSLAGNSSTILSYDISVNDNATAGQDTFRTTINYSDENSGTNYILNNPAVYDNWNVLQKSVLQVVAVNAVRTKVSQGQTGITVTVQVQNSGQVAAVVGTSDSVGVQFLRNLNTDSLTSPVLPDTIAGGDTTLYTFSVNVSEAAAVGIDSLRGFVIGRNIRTGEITSHTSNYLDSWKVQRPPQIAINWINSSHNQVNRDQQNVAVYLKWSNQDTTSATALLDSIGLYIVPGGNTSDTLVSSWTGSDSLTGGSSRIDTFNVDISLSAPDSLIVGSFYNIRDANTTTTFADTDSVNITHTWTIGAEGVLVVDSVFTETETMSLGQSGVVVRARITNNGDADVKIDSLRLTYNGLPTDSVLSSFLISPDSTNLPTLVTNETFIAEFRMDARSSPVITGNVTLNLDAFGTDLISTLPVQSTP
ncbi:MAG: Ig-like domain-containing protein, partial [Calditrichia bacterium]